MINDSQLLIPNQPTYCPVTGLPIISKPEWTDFRLDSDFTVTFSIIGDAILLTSSKGYSSHKGILCLFEKTSEIIHEAGLSGKKYIELKDYSMLMNIPPRAVRMAWSDYMLKEATKGYLLGVWVFGASLFHRLMFQAGQTINKPAIPFDVVKDYREAIQSALTVLRQKGVDVGERIQPGLTKNDWSLEIEGYGISFELIGDDTLYTIARGRLKEPDVDKFFKLHEKVLHEAGLFEKGYYYRILNWERLEGSSWQVRRLYIEGMKELNKEITCKMTVIFGLNPFMKALAEVSKPFIPAPVMIAKDFQDARAVIENTKESELKAGTTPKRQKHKEKTYTEAQVKGFADEMLQVMGELNWGQVGLSIDGIREEHPLRPVFDALAVIKLDLDELLREKEKSQKSLQVSEEKYRGILESITDSYFEIDLRGNMVFCNPILPKDLGYTQEEILGMNFRSYTDPETAETLTEIFQKASRKDTLASVLRYEITRRDGTKIPVETLFSLIKDRDGKAIGYRGTSRDITERKRAEEALRESEKRFTSIFNAQQNGIIIIDPETHRIVDINAAALHMIGATHEDAVERQCHRYICPAEQGQCPITDIKMDIDHAERDLIRTDHTKVPILKSVSRMTLGGKEFLIESFIDISDRKKAEEALHWKTALLEAQVNTSIDGILVVDVNNRRIITNRRLIDLWNIPQHVLDDEDDKALLNYVISLARWPDKFIEKVMYLYNHPYETSRDEIEFKSGMILDRYSAPVLGMDGNHYGRIWTFHDITERKKAVDALKESEEKYRNILESIEDGYFETDLAGNFTFFNPSMCAILGYSREEIPGMNYTKYMDNINAKRVFQVFNNVYKTGIPSKSFEWYITRKDGAKRYMEVSVSLIKDTEGSPNGFRGIARDISERKKAEEALKESEEKYRNILESIEDGYFEVDLTGNFTFFNPSMCRIYGYSPEEMLGMGYKRYTDDINATKVFQVFNKIYKTGIPSKGFEWNIIRKDGTKRHLEMSASLIADAGGRANGFRGIARDVSERKSIELELENHRNHLEELIKERTIKLMRTSNFLSNIINSSIDGIITTDIEGTILHTSPRITDILGYEPHEVMGKKVHTLFAGGYEESEKILGEVMKRGEIRGYELRSVKKSGESVVLNLSISLLRDEKGDITGTTSIYRDITEEKRMEEAMKQAMLRAEFANKAKSQFLANMSHEIRTPLNGIMGMTDLCLETNLNKEQRCLIDTINREATSLLEIVNEVLDFAKIESGKIEFEQIPFDLKNLLEDMAESSSYRTTRKGLKFISYLAPDLPTRLVGDPGRLRQVLRNLIDNAIKFTHEGEINVKADLAEDLDGRIKVRFLVKDTGIGIPKEKQAVIFESFTQADGSTTRKYGGTGLGITISKQMAELMGGTLGVESEEGKGSTFWFTAIFSRQSETDSPRRNDVPLGNVKVLIVDDSKSSRLQLTEYFRSWGSVPVEAENATEALSILRRSTADGECFNLVLSDLNMPKMNGFDLARKIRSIEPVRSIPIIIITAYGTPGDGKTCRDIGIEGYLTKPIGETDLRKAIEIVLGTSIRGEKTGRVDLVTKHSSAEMDRKDIRILLAEDYPTNQEIAKRYLDNAGYQVDLVEDGKQALEAFQRRHYDLILMDIQMPIMDGFEATAAIRTVETELAALGNENLNQMTRRVPIIAMTAHAMKDHQELCLEAGMDDFLAKPLSRKGLLAMVEKWLQSRPVPSSLTEADSHLPSKTRQETHPAEAHAGKSMNLVKALEEFEGDRDILAEVIDGFTRKVSEQIGTIRKALSCGDAETIRREAHSIKGGGANLTAEKLSKIAFELESKGKNEDLDGAGEIVNGLESELAALTLYVQENFSKLSEP